MIAIPLIYILILTLPGCRCQDIPCLDDWAYSQINGKCYKAIYNETTQAIASSICANMLTNINSIFKNIKPRLIRIQKTEDVNAFTDTMIKIGNNAPTWMDAVYNTKTRSWMWSDGSTMDIADVKLPTPKIDVRSQCLKLSYRFINNGPNYTQKYDITNVDCLKKEYYVCEHDNRPCDIVTLNLNPGSVEFIPNSISPFSYVFVACKYGYFRPAESSIGSQGQPGIFPKNYAYCTGTRAFSKDPWAYASRWNFSVIEPCLHVTCDPFTGTLNNVVNQILPLEANSQTSFPFGYAFNVSCIRGFVSYTDKRSPSASIVCQQSLFDKSLGTWNPEDYTPCVPVPCNLTSLVEMLPYKAAILSARNKVTQLQYDLTLQTSFLSHFNNIITIQCNDGFFFPDRTWAKQVICDMINSSLIHSDWQGYLGTSLPLYPSCEKSTCKYEPIFITPDKNLKPYFMMMNNYGIYINQTQPDGDPYPYQTRLMFYCNDGFNTGSGSHNQNLVCGPQGNWEPNLTPCIAIIPSLNIVNGRYYTPPPIEAVSAQTIGFVAIMALGIFLCLIISLDLSTAGRDMKFLKRNITNLINKRK